MINKYNNAPINLSEGKVFLDGIEVMDGVACTIKVAINTWTGKQLGERTPSTKVTGYAPTVTVTRRRNTPWLKELYTKYIKEGRTPEFTIQGIMDDKASDYYADYGSETVTAIGCVPTGDINLLNLDANGDILDDALNFNAKDVI